MRLKNLIRMLIGGSIILCFSIQAAVINHWDVQTKPHYWRFNFSLSQPIKYRAFTLKNPDRIVIDCYGVTKTIKFSRRDLVATPVNDIRVGRPSAGVLRIVLDLSHPIKLQTKLTKINSQRSRLSVDLIGQRQKVIGFAWPWGQQTSAVQTKPSLQAVSVAAPLRSSQVVVVVDPGHGGKDPGATGPRGVHEKTVVLAIAKKLAGDINAQPGFKAYLTRTGDYYLTLRQRLAVARRYKPDMFIAIHADAFRNRSATGASVFALSERGATSEAARWIAERENKSELMGGVDLSDKSNMLKSVLISLSQNVAIRSSIQIGDDIIKSLKHFTKLHHSKVEQAAFVVLKSPDIPSLLVETGFISNPGEERRLSSSKYQSRIALALKKGIVEYFTQHPPRNTWLAFAKSYPKQAMPHYKVLYGDTLSGIALHFSTSVTALKRFNQLKSNLLRAGQLLLIPRS